MIRQKRGGGIVKRLLLLLLFLTFCCFLFFVFAHRAVIAFKVYGLFCFVFCFFAYNAKLFFGSLPSSPKKTCLLLIVTITDLSVKILIAVASLTRAPVVIVSFAGYVPYPLGEKKKKKSHGTGVLYCTS